MSDEDRDPDGCTCFISPPCQFCLGACVECRTYFGDEDDPEGPDEDGLCVDCRIPEPLKVRPIWNEWDGPHCPPDLRDVKVIARLTGGKFRVAIGAHINWKRVEAWRRLR